LCVRVCAFEIRRRRAASICERRRALLCGVVASQQRRRELVLRARRLAPHFYLIELLAHPDRTLRRTTRCACCANTRAAGGTARRSTAASASFRATLPKSSVSQAVVVGACRCDAAMWRSSAYTPLSLAHLARVFMLRASRRRRAATFAIAYD
jgi:hypothetical protein